MATTNLCKICNSPYRAEVEQRALNGESAASIARWLSEKDFKISRASISRHLRFHFYPQRAEIAQQKRESLALAGQEAVKEINKEQVLADNVIKCVRIRNLLQEDIERALAEGRKPSYTLTSFYTSLTSEIRQNIALLHDIMSGPREVAVLLKQVYEELQEDTEESAD